MKKSINEDGNVETRVYDEQSDTLYVNTAYDPTPVIEANKRARAETPEFGKYNTSNSGLVHALRMTKDDVDRLFTMGYNLLSPDKDEFRRALMYIQQNEPWHIPVNGKPFARKRIKWQ